MSYEMDNFTDALKKVLDAGAPDDVLTRTAVIENRPDGSTVHHLGPCQLALDASFGEVHLSVANPCVHCLPDFHDWCHQARDVAALVREKRRLQTHAAPRPQWARIMWLSSVSGRTNELPEILAWRRAVAHQIDLAVPGYGPDHDLLHRMGALATLELNDAQGEPAPAKPYAYQAETLFDDYVLDGEDPHVAEELAADAVHLGGLARLVTNGRRESHVYATTRHLRRRREAYLEALAESRARGLVYVDFPRMPGPVRYDDDVAAIEPVRAGSALRCVAVMPASLVEKVSNTVQLAGGIAPHVIGTADDRAAEILPLWAQLLTTGMEPWPALQAAHAVSFTPAPADADQVALVPA